MGIVHAKDLSESSKYQATKTIPKVNINYEECEETKELELNVPARVDKIHVEGLGRTKNDIVEDALKDIFTANTFQEVLHKTHTARQKLNSLSLFRNVSVHIDVSKGSKATKDGLEVTFQVKELKRVVGGVNTQIGNNNEGSLVVGLKAPNVFGRGERLQTEYSYGSRRSNNYSVNFIKPFMGKRNPVFTAGVYQHTSEWPSSGYKQLERGGLLDFGFNSHHLLKHNLQYDACIRDMGVISRNSSFDVREQSGSTLKSALRHILTIDLRDEPIFPSCGSLLQLTSEFAGVGGDVGFLKNDFYLQANYSLMEDFVLQGTLSGGFMHEIGDEKKINLCDMYYLGGPLSLRGFKTRGVGPQSDGDALGSLCYFSGGLHLYTPLPFRPGKGGFGELFRTHLFVNAGNVADTKSEDVVEQLKNNLRVSSGIGVAIRLGQMARVEINYCFPHKFEQDDRVQEGIQFGVGVQFV
ncbi:PREDICTED: sorting and assembly machinery component 50 homolog B [Nicrophorus vespilloides]|uniref:Sorting and assembly machinery component 50 homolog B n=1 Tax=Nicrophorus vespilloides TaxID=110193 RepID=A0ABM1MBT0_NICVS|nr:PREDICTED: sorting and assembly machinery component 50 homolog B [Nicrophorus vespilloides]